jgi:hypothetical protein
MLVRCPGKAVALAVPLVENLPLYVIVEAGDRDRIAARGTVKEFFIER